SSTRGSASTAARSSIAPFRRTEERAWRPAKLTQSGLAKGPLAPLDCSRIIVSIVRLFGRCAEPTGMTRTKPPRAGHYSQVVEEASKRPRQFHRLSESHIHG